MTQHIAQEQISEWLDGQLDAQEAGRIEKHLRACDACHAIENEMSAVTRLFREAATLSPPPFLWTRIAAELQASTPGTPSDAGKASWLKVLLGHEGRPAWLQVRALAPAAIILMVLILGGSLTLMEYRSEARMRLAAIAEIDRAHTSIVAGNPKTSNPFRASAEFDLHRNPFSTAGTEQNPFRPLLDEHQGKELK